MTFQQRCIAFELGCAQIRQCDGQMRNAGSGLTARETDNQALFCSVSANAKNDASSPFRLIIEK